MKTMPFLKLNARSILAWGAISLLGNAQAFSQTPEFTDLILITGQSNVRASGTAYNAAIDTPHPQVFAFTSNGTWQQADLHQAWDVNNWQPGNGSLNEPDRTPYNNFALHLGKEIVAQDPSRIVGFVLASAPGRGIGYWDPDYPTQLPNEKNFYEIVQAKVKQALAAQSSKIRLDAIFWHQGETDWQIDGTSDVEATNNERSHKPYYKEKLTALIENFRSSPDITDNAIFICGETAAAPVNARLMALNYDPQFRTSCVASDDLGTKDGTHFNASGLRELGRRYGERYAEMVNAKPFPGKLLRNKTWEQIGIPANSPNLSLATVFGNQLPLETYDNEWQVYRYEALQGQYKMMLADDPLEQGTGYWIIQATGEDRTIHMSYNATDTPVQTSAACASANGCFPIPIFGSQSPTWNLLSYPHAEVGIYGSSRLKMGDGVCPGGCTIAQASALHLIEQTVWSYSGEQSSYIAITQGDHWYPWSGFWMAADGAIGEKNSTLLTTRP